MIFTDDLETRHGFLSALHRLLSPKVYLEVGVQHGTSLRLAERAKIAVGIDPEPQATAFGNQHIFATTSDRFFEDGALGLQLLCREHGFEEAKVDLAFIDGMHHAENALRDLLNLEPYCHRGSLVVLDDVLPRNEHEARRVAPREPIVGDWTGDVWKIREVLNWHRPDLTTVLVNTWPTGLLLVYGFDRIAYPLAPKLQAGEWAELERPKDPPQRVIDRVDAVPPPAAIQVVLDEDLGPR